MRSIWIAAAMLFALGRVEASATTFQRTDATAFCEAAQTATALARDVRLSRSGEVPAEEARCLAFIALMLSGHARDLQTLGRAIEDSAQMRDERDEQVLLATVQTTVVSTMALASAYRDLTNQSLGSYPRTNAMAVHGERAVAFFHESCELVRPVAVTPR